VEIADFAGNLDAPGKPKAAAAERGETGVVHFSVFQTRAERDASCAFYEPLGEGGSHSRSGYLDGGGTGLLCAQRGRAAKTHEEEKRERILVPTEIHSISRIVLLLYLYILLGDERTTSSSEGFGDQDENFRKRADMKEMMAEICVGQQRSYALLAKNLAG
jgi:hypothetical protein